MQAREHVEMRASAPGDAGVRMRRMPSRTLVRAMMRRSPYRCACLRLSPSLHALQGVLNYLASEVHASYGPLFGPGSDEFKAAQKAKLATKFKYVDEEMLGAKPFLTGEHFTVADSCA
jgi:glutathione S-transferase